MNSIPCDYVVRQKIGGIHLNITMCKQLPIPLPDRVPRSAKDRILEIGLELVYTSPSLIPFAQSLGHEAPPFVWDEERRAVLRAELDGLYGHLYGLTRDELSYILDTFPIVRRKDEERYGEYRTKRMVLEAYERLESLR
jgi:hypothetical protein